MKKFITIITVFLCTVFRVVLRIIGAIAHALKIFKNPCATLPPMKFSFFVLALVVSSIIHPHSTFAHSGRTAKDGCHNDKKAGSRHCHNGSSTSTKLKTQSTSKYERHTYGGWIDADEDGQNTRHEVLIEENIGTLVLSPDGKK